MDNESSSPAHEYGPSKVDDSELISTMKPEGDQEDHESSSDDVPLRQRRPLRAPTHNLEDSHDLRDRRQLRQQNRDSNDTSILDQRRADHKATLRKPTKAVAKPSGKVAKKPGPRPWASKPIMKNDMVAKKEVIREIECYWGKGFIRAYIPKCHRPLVKRGKGGKRAMYRDHETDPKKWLPSVLKAVLMIAKLTNNKVWLRKAMNDVVRYRIKNTGNRKPQLVTTDFDVIEDMLVKDWDVDYSFDIRYKHLLVNRHGQQDTDEDIDHILAIESGPEEGSDEDDEVKDEVNSNNDDEDDSDDDMGQGGLTGQYLHASGYIDAPQYSQSHAMPVPPPKYPKVKKEKSSQSNPQLPSRPQPPSYSKKDHHGHGQAYPYGPPMGPWGRSMPYGGGGPDNYGGYGAYGMYGGHGGYGKYGGYGPPPDDNGRHPSQPPDFADRSQYPPRHHTMTSAPKHPDTDRIDRLRIEHSPFPKNLRMTHSIEQSPFGMGRPGYQHYGHPRNLGPDQTELKEESPEFEARGSAREMSVNEVDEPSNDLGEHESAAAVEAELRATELELKVARLQAKRAALNQSRAK